MGISESKKKIVIDNYFKSGCDVNTSIKEAFTKGFELGLKKAPVKSQSKVGRWLCSDDMFEYAVCSLCKVDTREPFEYAKRHFNYCSNCGAKMIEPQESEEA